MRLRLLSYNIQLGLSTGHYGHYVTRAWRHVLPSTSSRVNLDRIAELMQGYDFVAVQEADAGSLRTRRLNQVEYLAKLAGYPHWGLSVTRNLRPVAQHCLGYLSRLKPEWVEEHVLPSRIPGRRVLSVKLGPAGGGLTLLLTHLSLSRQSRHRQFDYLSKLVAQSQPVVLMGDLNCEPGILRGHPGLGESGLCVPDETPATFPSWRPYRCIDHILVSQQVKMHSLQALPLAISDHLPLAAEIGVPRIQ